MQAVRDLFDAQGDTIACVIVEPVVGNMGCVPPHADFLPCPARSDGNATAACLIFDEVMTGFRLAYGGAQERFGITPDMTTLGKIVGGGLPLGAYGGSAEIMDSVAPVGPVYQAGTLSGNPVAVTAGLAMLRLLRENKADIYAAPGNHRRTDWRRACAMRRETHNVPVVVNQVGSMLTVFFTEAPEVTDYATAKTSDTARFGNWFRALLEEGVYWPPSQFEAAFLSAIMTDDDIAFLLAGAEKAFEGER